MGVCKRRINKPDGRCVHYIFPDSEREPGFCTLAGEYHCVDNCSAKIPRLSHSAILDWLKCRHCFYLKKIRGISMKENQCSPAVKMGSLWDVVLGKLLGVNTAEDIKAIVDLYEIGDKERVTVRSIMRAYKALGLEVEPGFEAQKRFVVTNQFVKSYPWLTNDKTEFAITGIYDRVYEDHFAENKFTGKPDLYQDILFLSSQLGTYFLSDDNFEYCIMEIVRTPALKLGDDEDVEVFGERLYKDIMKRPSWYFIGYNNMKRTYGKKFYRREFALDEVAARYGQIGYEIMDANERDAFYKNPGACHVPFECDMIDICRHGVMSEEIYKFKDKVSEERSAKLDELGDEL